jgi:hypothetical protein
MYKYQILISALIQAHGLIHKRTTTPTKLHGSSTINIYHTPLHLLYRSIHNRQSSKRSHNTHIQSIRQDGNKDYSEQ